ncbi:MAG TPA: hypothetical protein VF814_09555 [Casimicrobiaceae bacterium]
MRGVTGGLLRVLLRRGFEAVAVFLRCKIINRSLVNGGQGIGGTHRRSADRVDGRFRRIRRLAIVIMLATVTAGPTVFMSATTMSTPMPAVPHSTEHAAEPAMPTAQPAVPTAEEPAQSSSAVAPAMSSVTAAQSAVPATAGEEDHDADCDDDPNPVL